MVISLAILTLLVKVKNQLYFDLRQDVKNHTPMWGMVFVVLLVSSNYHPMKSICSPVRHSQNEFQVVGELLMIADN